MSAKRKNKQFSFDEKACIFCLSEEDNEILFGKFLITDVIRMHTNCMFFASGLIQQGRENDQFLGFLVPDIEAEIRRGRKLFCSYCRKRGATVGCCITACKKSFHLKCGMENGSLHQFFGTFPSYCKDHKPKQSKLKIEDEFFCFICCETIQPAEVESCLYSPCCKKNLFHKFCLQKYALSAGLYFFKCPLCNNSKQFIKEMKKFGINIPQKDASWELEENAYRELLVKPECDAPVCLCPGGRDYRPTNESEWMLITCSYCGFHARHKECETIESEDEWLCEECTAMNDEISKNKAFNETGNKTESGNTILCLSPKVLLENCLISKSSLHYCDDLLNTDDVRHIVKPQGSCISDTELPETSTSETTEFGNTVDNNSIQTCGITESHQKPYNMDSPPETPVIAGPSIYKLDNEVRKESQMLLFTNNLCKLGDRVANLRDIKNVAFNSQVKRMKNNLKNRASPKVVKKQKVDNQSSSKNNQPLITSYFGHSYEKKIRL